MKSRQKTNESLDEIHRKLRSAMGDIGCVIGHLNEGEADDFSDLHEIDRRDALECADSIVRHLEEIKLDLNQTVEFLRRA
jgi:hypothetical protein